MNLCPQLDPYLDGELADPQAQAFEQHLLTCEACRLEVEADRQLDHALQSAWSNINAPATIGEALQLVPQPVASETGGRTPRRWSSVVLAASLLAALAGASWLVWFRVSGENEITQTLVEPEPPTIASTLASPADQPASHQIVTVLFEQGSQTILRTESTGDEFTILTAYEVN